MDRTIHPNTVFGSFPSIDVLVLILLLLGANTHLIAGDLSADLIFLPRPFLSGDWWRLITFPFVHTGWYHLFLDAGAFLLLYTGLTEQRPFRRLLCVATCSSFSLTTVWLTTPEIDFLGLNGLSGIGHGLMALSTLELAESRQSRLMGIAGFGALVFKCLFELITGTVLFHFGLCGTPLAASHGGGVLGGIFLFKWCRGTLPNVQH
jgi:rhomboid family GlyGly-CTERM serine protease